MEKKEKNKKAVKGKNFLRLKGFIELLSARRLRQSIKVIDFDIKESPDKQYSINFTAFVSNNTTKTISVSERYLHLYDRKIEVEKICVVESKQKKKSKEEFQKSPDDTITLKPGESKKVYIENYVIDQKPIDKAKFKCLIGKHSRVVQIKISKALHQKNEELIDEMNELENQLFREKIKGKIETLNKNIGAITWITTALLAVTAAGLKFLWYVYQSGQLLYWKIEASAISIVDDMTLYYLFMSLIFALLVLGIMLIPYMIINSKIKILIKVVSIILLFGIFSFVVIIRTGLNTTIQEYGVSGFFAVEIVVLIAFLFFFGLGYILGIGIDPRQVNRNNEKKLTNGLIFFVIWLIMVTTFSYGMGYLRAKTQTTFRITNGEYAVIFETKEYYYLAKYNKEEKIVEKDHHIIVEKGNIEYFYDENR